MTDEELLFENLFKRHLSDWPNVIPLDLYDQECVSVMPTEHGYDLVKYKDILWDGNKKAYVVGNLDEIAEVAIKKYSNTVEEIIWNSLNRAINGTIWSLAYYMCELKIHHLRSEEVRKQFEKSLKWHIFHKELFNWSSDQIILAKRYFKVNGVPIRKKKTKAVK